MDEMLPALEDKDGTIVVTGPVLRSWAHGANPVFHATSVIVPLLPDGCILFADKTEKQLAKGRVIPEGVRVFDIFGGHMGYSDVTEDDREFGLSQKAYRECAARELSEELLIEKAQGEFCPFPVVAADLIPIGFFRMENDHNKEFSWAYLYQLPEEGSYASVDTLIQNGEERILSQPLINLKPEEAIQMYLKKENGTILFGDAFGRIVEPDNGEALLRTIREVSRR